MARRVHWDGMATPAAREAHDVRELLSGSALCGVAVGLLRCCQKDQAGRQDVANHGLPLLVALLHDAGEATSIALEAIHMVLIDGVDTVARRDILNDLNAARPLERILAAESEQTCLLVRSILDVLRRASIPELGLELWGMIWSWHSRCDRFGVLAAVCWPWRRAILEDPSLWSRLVVLADSSGAPPRAMLQSAPSVSDGAVSAPTDEVAFPALAYIAAGYLCVLPRQLRHVRHPAHVHFLVVVEPALDLPSTRQHGGRDDQSKLAHARYWAALAAVCAIRFPAMLGLRISFEALERFLATGAQPRAQVVAACETTLFPWLRALPPTLRWLALDGEAAGSSIAAAFEHWHLRRSALAGEVCEFLSWLPLLHGLRYPCNEEAARGFSPLQLLRQLRPVQREQLQAFEACGANRRATHLSAAEVIEACRLLPSLTALAWRAADVPRAEWLARVAQALPPSLSYISCDFDGDEDVRLGLTLADWGVLAR